MRMMPKLLLLLFSMSVVTMVFIARCGLNIESQVGVDRNNGGMPTSENNRSPGEKALREVLRRKEVEHFRDKSVLEEKIKELESQLMKVQKEVVNMTDNLKPAEDEVGGVVEQRENQWVLTKNPAEVVFNADMMMMRNGGETLQQGNRARPVIRYDDSGRKIVGNRVRAHRARNAAGESVQSQRRVIRGQSDDYPLLDARMSQDFFPDANVNNFPQGKETQLGNNNLRFEGNDNRNSFGRQGFVGEMDNGGKGEEEGVGRGNNMGFPGGVNNKNVETINADGYRYQRSVFENNQLSNDSRNNITDKSNSVDYLSFIKERLKSAEVERGVAYKTEYELIPFNRFVFNRIFMVDPGLGKRVVGKPIGSKKKDMNEILAHAINTLNVNRTQGQGFYSHDDFIEGIHRTDPSTGTHYELVFKNKDDNIGKKRSPSSHTYIKLDVVRPFSPPMTIQKQSVNTDDEWINIILPLSGRLDTFRLFLNQFINVCIKQDKRVYLTVVYFGTSGLKEVKTMMSRVAKTNKFKHMKLITLNEKFTRGRALQIGALNWKHGDVLLFFCDVDIVFTTEFLERCRLNTGRGQRVYYPIVFSLYNPNIVYSLQDAAIPAFHDQLVLSKDTGFWRDFGYGMTCQYRSDFLKIKGFDEQITGWGGEDVFLYQKFVRSEYFVIRATDPAIFHLWHEKYCDPTLTAEQYRSCIRSKALNEASHPQLGLLAFKDEINVHRSVSERNSHKTVGVSSARSKQRRNIQDADNALR